MGSDAQLAFGVKFSGKGAGSFFYKEMFVEMSGKEFFRDEMTRGFCRGELFWGLSFQGKTCWGRLGQLYSWGAPIPMQDYKSYYTCVTFMMIGGHPD